MEAIIGEFLDNYQDLWWKINKEYNYDCMDVVGDIVELDNHFGINFSGSRRVWQFFFMGQHNYFPFIWIGKDNYEETLDTFPVYIIDCIRSDNPLKCKGNFRTYMTNLIKKFLDEYRKKDGYRKKAIQALSDLQIFSEDIIHQDEYRITRAKDEYF
jgi:hypothetical protein